MKRIASRAVILAFALTLSSCDGDDNASSLGVSCSASPGSGRAPLPVEFTGQASGGSGSYVYSWSFSDGAGSAAPNVSRLFGIPGVYSAVLEARSGSQRATCTTSVTAQAVPAPSPANNVAPLPRFKINPNPPSGKAPLTVDFNACMTTDPEGDRILFIFDVGDGPYESHHCRREHTYRTAGRYNTSICVNDGFAGHADQCQTYTVSVN